MARAISAKREAPDIMLSLQAEEISMKVLDLHSSTKMSLTVRYHWTTPLREALVKAVEKREKLWKKYPVVSHNSDLRAKLWAEVADELTEQYGVLIDTEDMKKTWKNLKDNYWRIIKGFDTEPERARRWKFYDAMRFMERACIDEMNKPSKSVSSDSNNQPSTSKSRIVLPVYLVNKEALKEKHSQRPPLYTCANELPLQLKGMSGNAGRKNRRSKNGPHTNKPTSFIQISIPELDALISKKQRPAFGSQIQCMPADYAEDDLATALEPIWNQLEGGMSATPKDEQNQLDQKNLVRKVESEVELAAKKYKLAIDVGQKFAELIKLSQFPYELDDKALNTIVNGAAKLRGFYHQYAFSYFVKENMPEGELHQLLGAFDNFVYNGQPRDPVISKVINACDAHIFSGFTALFTLIERYRGQLHLSLPNHRWGKMDKDSQINMYKYPAKQRRKQPEPEDLGDLGEAELHRIRSSRAVLAKKIKEYAVSVQSTQNLLKKTDYNKLQKRIDLINTLRNTRIILEKTKKEQQQLEMEYNELQKKNNANKQREKKAAQKSAQEEKTTFEDVAEEKAPSPDELFEDIVKEEPL